MPSGSRARTPLPRSRSGSGSIAPTGSWDRRTRAGGPGSPKPSWAWAIRPPGRTGYVQLASDGRIWSQVRLPGDSVEAWQVHSPDGTLIAIAELPRRFEIHQIGGDFVLGRRWDAADVEHISAYRLIPDTTAAAVTGTTHQDSTDLASLSEPLKLSLRNPGRGPGDVLRRFQPLCDRERVAELGGGKWGHSSTSWRRTGGAGWDWLWTRKHRSFAAWRWVTAPLRDGGKGAPNAVPDMACEMPFQTSGSTRNFPPGSHIAGKCGEIIVRHGVRGTYVVAFSLRPGVATLSRVSRIVPRFPTGFVSRVPGEAGSWTRRP
jgi:hypothetical protein